MRSLWLVLLLLATLTLSGCEAVVDIFQAGFAVGVIAVVAILALVGFLVVKMRR
jgi:uncharacterized protein YceK